MLHRVSTRLGREDGVALVMAVIVVAALTISTAAIVQLTTSNQRAFTRDRLETRAFNTAEEGLNTGIAFLRGFDSGAVPQNTTQGSSAYPIACCDGLGGWWAVKSSATQWTIFAIGRAPNGDVLRTLSMRAQADTVTTTTQPSLAWANGFFVGDATGCTNMVGTASIRVPVWIAGDLCLNGTQQIEEPSSSEPAVVSVHVGGKLYVTGSARVGSSTRRIATANIVGGCLRGGTGYACSNATQSRVWATTPNGYSAVQSTLTKPPVYPDTEYASGSWSTPVCSTGSFTFDNDTTRNTSVGAVDLFPSTAYDCRVYNGSGVEVGRLAWNGSNALTIDGKVFIDGNLALNGGDQAGYTGFGAIFVNGTVATSGNSSLCGPGATVNGSTCNGLWDANLGALGIVALNASNLSPAWNMSGNAEYNVLAYVVGLFSETGTSKVTGPVVTDRAIVAGTPDHTSDSDPPPEMPGASTTTSAATWSAVPGSWQQLVNG
ncbi:MAG: pilus assembly PilX family protein [Gaiella sp.]